MFCIVATLAKMSFIWFLIPECTSLLSSIPSYQLYSSILSHIHSEALVTNPFDLFFSCMDMFSFIFDWRFYMFYIRYAIPSASFSKYYQSKPSIAIYLPVPKFKPFKTSCFHLYNFLPLLNHLTVWEGGTWLLRGV